jgi:hypothetical protein
MKDELMVCPAVTAIGLVTIEGRPTIMVTLLKLDPAVIARIPARTEEGVDVRYELGEQAFAAAGGSGRDGILARLRSLLGRPAGPTASPRSPACRR